MNSVPPRRNWLDENVRWIVVTLLIPFIGFVWDQVNARQAERQAQEASVAEARQKRIDAARAVEDARLEGVRRDSQLVVQLLPALGDADPNSPMRSIALAILGNMANRGALSADLVQAVELAIRSTEARVRSGAASDVEKQALTAVAATADAPTVAVSESVAPASVGPKPALRPAIAVRVALPRVYIHIFDAADDAKARELAAWIESTRRWLVPGIENVTATAARSNARVPHGSTSTDVRFFNREDLESAKRLEAWLRQNGVPDARVVGSRVRAPAGQIEVWFPQRAG